MVQSNDPQNLNDNAAAPEGDAALGFETSNAPKDEKYNTRYLVATMQSDRRNSMLLGVGVVVAAIIGILMWVALKPAGEAAHEGAAPAAEVAPAAEGKTPAPSEAPKAPAPSETPK